MKGRSVLVVALLVASATAHGKPPAASKPQTSWRQRISGRRLATIGVRATTFAGGAFALGHGIATGDTTIGAAGANLMILSFAKRQTLPASIFFATVSTLTARAADVGPTIEARFAGAATSFLTGFGNLAATFWPYYDRSAVPAQPAAPPPARGP
jgi:hypothetical protein